MRRWSQAFYGGINRHKLKLEVLTGYKEQLFPPEDGQAVEQAAWRGCAVFILGGFQDLAGSTWADLRADPALNKRLDQSSPEVPSNLSFPMILVSPVFPIDWCFFLTISNREEVIN